MLTFVRQPLPSLVPIQRDRHEGLVRIADVERILGHLFQGCRDLDALVCRLELCLCQPLRLRFGDTLAWVLVCLV